MEKNTFQNILDEPIPKLLKLQKSLAPKLYTPRISITYEKELEEKIRKQKRRYEELEEELFNLKKAKLEESITIDHQESLGGQINEYVFKRNEGGSQELFNKFCEVAPNKIVELINKFATVKINLSAYVDVRHLATNSVTSYFTRHKIFQLTQSDIPNISEILKQRLNFLIGEKLGEESLGQSGLVYEGLNTITLVVSKTSRTKGSSYIELPKSIANKKATINVQNSDNECFKWAILSIKHRVNGKNHPNRVTHYTQFENELSFKDIEFPVRIKDIPKFEKQNNLAINVFGYYNSTQSIDAIYNLHISIFHDIPEIYDKKIELLYIEDTDHKNGHYVGITDFNKLAAKIVNGYTRKVTKNSYFNICRKCIVPFNSEKEYVKHLQYCKTGSPAVKLPEENDKILKFKNYHRKFRHHLAIYADTEALLVKEGNKTIHKVCSMGILAVTDIELGTQKMCINRGENCVRNCFDHLKLIVDEYFKKSQSFPQYDSSSPDVVKAKQSQKCWLCEGTVFDYSSDDWKPVIDHCHATGKILGLAHSICNSKRTNNQFVPIYFHNLSNYDAHFIVDGLKYFGEAGQITIIPKTDENYIAFSKDYTPSGRKKAIKLQFLDSYRMLPSSLDELASNLLKSNGIESFKNFKNYFAKNAEQILLWNEKVTETKKQTILKPNYDVEFKEEEQTLEIPRLKGIYPYEFTDSWDKFKHSEVLTRENFYDSLNKKEISEQAYQQYLKVWQALPSKTLGNYSDLYLMTDIIVLADVFETFRDTCLNSYQLDPVYYYTSPGLFWESMLKKTKVELELLTDYNMILMMENGIRGGVSTFLGDQYVDVENKNFITNPELSKDDTNQEWLLYIDCNNLYGNSMIKKLPQKDFKWLNEKNITDLDYMIRNRQVTGDEDVGYILKVDLKVPKSEEFHNFPLAPERKTVKYEELSEYSRSMLGTEKMGKCEKLILDLKDKTDYIIHMKNLLLYQQLGCDFIIKDGISFFQSNWLEPYVQFNTKMRTESRNEFEKDFFKLANNSVFGKTMENVRNYVEISLSDSWKKAIYYIRKPTFSRIKIFNDNLVAIHMEHAEVYFNKPVYVGFAVLEHSKHLMYDFYYNKLKKMFKDVKALYTDTDSLILHIKDRNIYEIMHNNKAEFDFSDYPREHNLYSSENKKVIGKFKDELNGVLMTKYCGIRSKLYGYKKHQSEVEHIRFKGIKRSEVKRTKFDDLCECLFNNKKNQYNFKLIKSKNHVLETVDITKKGLDPYDSKRYYLNNIQSKPYGFVGKITN